MQVFCRNSSFIVSTKLITRNNATKKEVNQEYHVKMGEYPDIFIFFEYDIIVRRECRVVVKYFVADKFQVKSNLCIINIMVQYNGLCSTYKYKGVMVIKYS